MTDVKEKVGLNVKRLRGLWRRHPNKAIEINVIDAQSLPYGREQLGRFLLATIILVFPLSCMREFECQISSLV